MSFDSMLEKAKSADGFIAALDQSGGSTPKALRLYGIPDKSYVEGEESMFDVVHQMRSRIITSSAFTGEKILGAILFEDTMQRDIDGIPTARYLWEKKGIIPFIKVDKGLAPEENGCQMMKPMPQLEDLLKQAKEAGCLGTKMRSNINSANEIGIKAVVDQQFQVGKTIIAAGLVPIIEPEVNIKAVDKEECENILKRNILSHLEKLEDNQKVMLKLTLPSVQNFYQELIQHPNVIRVVALSGGYTRDEANSKLSKQKGMIASFSRALTEGLTHQMSDEEFEAQLGQAINSIFEASKAG